MKGWSVERQSEEAIGSEEGADNRTRRSEGPPAGCADRPGRGCGHASGLTTRGIEARGPGGLLGPTTNAVARRNVAGRRPGGKPCEGEPHARFGKGALETGGCAPRPRDMGAGEETTRDVRPQPTEPAGPRQRPTSPEPRKSRRRPGKARRAWKSSAEELPGVRGAGWSEGGAGNWGGPPRPWAGGAQARVARITDSNGKSRRAGRASDGAVLPVMVGTTEPDRREGPLVLAMLAAQGGVGACPGGPTTP